MPCRPGLAANIQPEKIRLYSFFSSTSSTSTKVVVCGGLGRRPRVAGALGDLQRAELHRFVGGDLEGDDAPGDLVEAGKHRPSDD